jgi:hypothetical protein
MLAQQCAERGVDVRAGVAATDGAQSVALDRLVCFGCSGDDAGLRRYRALIDAEFAAYAETRAQFYAEERRWPESEFWRRRVSPSPPRP